MGGVLAKREAAAKKEAEEAAAAAAAAAKKKKKKKKRASFHAAVEDPNYRKKKQLPIVPIITRYGVPLLSPYSPSPNQKKRGEQGARSKGPKEGPTTSTMKPTKAGETGNEAQLNSILRNFKG